MPLLDEIEAFAAECLPTGYELDSDGRQKAIHDSVWGTHVFQPWEVDLLDTPLIQRLRGIRQTGLTNYTFPSVQTTRFEHTLGCTAVASRLFEEVSNQKNIDSAHVTDCDRNELR